MVQVMVAELVVIEPALTPLITGAGAEVVKVKFVDVVEPPESAEMTA